MPWISAAISTMTKAALRPATTRFNRVRSLIFAWYQGAAGREPPAGRGAAGREPPAGSPRLRATGWEPSAGSHRLGALGRVLRERVVTPPLAPHENHEMNFMM